MMQHRIKTTPLQNEVESHVNDFCMMQWGVTKKNLRANLPAAFCSREPNLAAENQVKKTLGVSIVHEQNNHVKSHTWGHFSI
jgi:hypothetical protein